MSLKIVTAGTTRLADVNLGAASGAQLVPGLQGRGRRGLGRRRSSGFGTGAGAGHPLGVGLPLGTLRVNAGPGVRRFATDRATLALGRRLEWQRAFHGGRSDGIVMPRNN